MTGNDLRVVPEGKLCRASFAQQRFWLLDRLARPSPVYNISLACDLDGPLAEAALCRALRAVQRRHGALRTEFVDDQGELWQRVRPDAELPYEFDDLVRLGNEADAEAERRAAREARHIFDLTQGPLWRALLLRLSPERHTLVLTAHHIVSDGWSFRILLDDLGKAYTAALERAEAPFEPAPQYPSFAEWERRNLLNQSLDKARAYWKRRCQGVPDLALPTDHPRPPVQRWQGARVVEVLGPELTRRITSLAAENNVTLFLVLLATFDVVLYRSSGQSEFCVGIPVRGRPLRELDQAVGLFVGTLPIRTRIEANDTFERVVEIVRDSVLEAMEFQELPFEKLVEEVAASRDLSRNPVFQVMFVLQNLPGKASQLHNLHVHPRELSNGTSKLDLTLAASQSDGGIVLDLEYNTDLWSDASAARLLGHVRAALEAVVDHPRLPIGTLSLLQPGEREQVLVHWNATNVDLGPDVCLHQLLGTQAAERTTMTAVVAPGLAEDSEDQELTYGEFERLTNQLARQLRARGARRGVHVAICLSRSWQFVATAHAVLKSGAAFVPLDPELPGARLAFLLEDSAPVLTVTEREFVATLPIGAAGALFVLNESWDSIEAEPIRAPDVDSDPADPAYVLYTSGSTGQPRGVVVNHRALVNRLRWMGSALHVGIEDRVLHKTPCGFDVSVWELFLAGLSGGTLVIAPPGAHRDSAELVQLIMRHRVTLVHFVPPMLRSFVKDPGAPGCASLTRVVCSGDVLSRDLQDCFHAVLDCALYNLYGPTEAAIDVTWWHCDPRSSLPFVPIGRPIANVQIFILDDQLQPVPPGVPGEVCIGGVALADKYLGRDDLTQERFVANPNPPWRGRRLYRTGDRARFLVDGNIHFLGRVDSQLKVGGNRVEAGEVEAALRAHPTVEDAVVSTIRDAAGESLLIAHVVGLSAGIVPALQAFLRARLPRYAVPSAFVPLSELPLSANGKIDRAALPPIDPSRLELTKTFVPPKTETERALAAIWCEVLGLNRVGTEDAFFELGGDSIRILQVVAKSRAHSLHPTVEDCLRFQTIAALARRLESASEDGGEEAQEPTPMSLISPQSRRRLPPDVVDAFPLSALQTALLIELARGGDRYRVYTTSYRVRGRYDEPALRRALVRTVEDHPLLRASVVAEGLSEPLVLVHPTANVPIRTLDWSTEAEDGLHDRLHEWLDEEARLPFDWSQAPLLRVSVHRLSAAEFWVTLAEPWLDGWSVAVLGSELLTRYSAPGGELVTSVPSYSSTALAGYVAAERTSEKSEPDRAFWSETLADVPDTLIVPPSRPPVQGSNRTLRLPVVLPPELGGRLRQLANRLTAPLKSVLLAAHARVVGLMSGRDEIVLALMSNGRPSTASGVRMVGLFLNVMPLRVRTRSGTWSDLVRQVLAAEQRALPHRRYPLSSIRRDRGGTIPFDALFNFTDFHPYGPLMRPHPEGIELQDVVGSDQTYFPVTAQFSVEEGSRVVRLDLDLNLTAGASETFSASLANCYRHALNTLVESPEQSLTALPSWFVRDELAVGLSVSRGQTEPTDDQRGIATVFEQQVERTPTRPALLFKGAKWSYRELHDHASSVCATLVDAGVGAGATVAVCLPRGPGALAAILGILQAGAAFVPLDINHPPPHRAKIVADAGAAAIITMERTSAGWTGERTVISLTEALDSGRGDAAKARSGNASDPAYIMYTSGTTGTPKGVVTTHRSVLNRCRWMWNAHPFEPGEMVCQKTSLSFVDSVWELFGGLLCGVPTLMLRDETVQAPERFASSLAAGPKKRLALVQTQLRDLLRLGPAVVRNANVSLWVLSGEVLPPNLANALRRAQPTSTILNLYGSTEVSADVTAYELVAPLDPDSPVPIGRPILNTVCRVVGPDLETLPMGLVGELLIGGEGVALGYHNQPELTARRFVEGKDGSGRLFRTGDAARIREDGLIEFMGRLDRQVKIRGVRVDLASVEQAVEQHPAVARAAVTVGDGSSADPILIAYLQAQDLPDDLGSTLRRNLSSQYPAALIPSRWIAMARLPVNTSGKVDYAALSTAEGQVLDGGLEGEAWPTPWRSD